MKNNSLESFVVVDDMPASRIKMVKGKLWVLMDIGEDYIHLGHAPKPKNSWEGFWYHVFNGLLMHYPVHKVLQFSWKYKSSFQEFD